MRIVIRRERKFRFQIGLEVCRNLDGVVNLCLQTFALFSWTNTGCFGCTEESRLPLKPLALLRLGFSSKSGIVNALHCSCININLGAGCNAKSLVDSAERNTIDIVWACHQKQARFFKLFQENHTTTTESASKQDENSARSD